MVVDLSGRGLNSLAFDDRATSGSKFVTDQSVALKGVRTLRANNNSIEYVRGLGLFSNLRTLELSDNRIVSLDSAELPPGLRTLIVPGNLLSSIAFIVDLEYLQHLDVSRNAIRTLSLAVSTGRRHRHSVAPNLTHLYAADNAIDTLEPAVGCFPKLQVLDLRRNDVVALLLQGSLCEEAALASMTALRELQLDLVETAVTAKTTSSGTQLAADAMERLIGRTGGVCRIDDILPTNEDDDDGGTRHVDPVTAQMSAGAAGISSPPHQDSSFRSRRSSSSSQPRGDRSSNISAESVLLRAAVFVDPSRSHRKNVDAPSTSRRSSGPSGLVNDTGTIEDKGVAALRRRVAALEEELSRKWKQNNQLQGRVEDARAALSEARQRVSGLTREVVHRKEAVTLAAQEHARLRFVTGKQKADALHAAEAAQFVASRASKQYDTQSATDANDDRSRRTLRTVAANSIRQGYYAAERDRARNAERRLRMDHSAAADAGGDGSMTLEPTSFRHYVRSEWQHSDSLLRRGVTSPATIEAKLLEKATVAVNRTRSTPSSSEHSPLDRSVQHSTRPPSRNSGHRLPVVNQPPPPLADVSLSNVTALREWRH